MSTTKTRKSPSPTSGSNPISQHWIPNCNLCRGWRKVSATKHAVVHEQVTVLVPIGQTVHEFFKGHVPGWDRSRGIEVVAHVSSDAIRRVVEP